MCKQHALLGGMRQQWLKRTVCRPVAGQHGQQPELHAVQHNSSARHQRLDHLADLAPPEAAGCLQRGLKTGMYYLRTRAAADAIKFTVDQLALAKTKAARVAAKAAAVPVVPVIAPLKVQSPPAAAPTRKPYSVNPGGQPWPCCLSPLSSPPRRCSPLRRCRQRLLLSCAMQYPTFWTGSPSPCLGRPALGTRSRGMAGCACQACLWQHLQPSSGLCSSRAVAAGSLAHRLEQCQVGRI